MKVGAKRTRPNRATQSVVGSSRDLEVLQSLAWARFLTTSQVMRLHFPSKRTCQRRLRALLDHGLIRAHLQGAALHIENVFTLTPRGAVALEAVGMSNIRPSRLPRLQKLGHGIAIRDVFVAFVLAERLGGFLLEDFRFEEDLAQEPLFKTAEIVPDALAVLDHGNERLLVGCEIDLGTETTLVLRAKLTAWKALLKSRVLGSAVLLVAPTTETRHRTFLRLFGETGCEGSVLSLSTLIASPDALIELYAPGVRAVRIEDGEEVTLFQPIWG